MAGFWALLVILSFPHVLRAQGGSSDEPLDENFFFWSYYETGELWYANTIDSPIYASLPYVPCFTAPEAPGQGKEQGGLIDLRPPCADMYAFFDNCSVGISVLEDSRTNVGLGSNAAYKELPNDQQQQCYCGGEYWTYNRGCNKCLQTHGFPPGRQGHLANDYISQQSSAYCSGKPTLNFREFLSLFHPSKTLDPGPTTELAAWTYGATETASYEVSAYFTAPSSTPVFPSGTAAVTSLQGLSGAYNETVPALMKPTTSSSLPEPTNKAPAKLSNVPLGLLAAMSGLVFILNG